MNIIKSISKFWAASIRRQLMLGIIIVHAVLMTIFVFDLVNRQRDFLHEQSISQAHSLAKTLAANSVSWILSNDIIGLEEILESQNSYPDLKYAMVLSPDGRVLGHTDDGKTGLFIVDDVSQGLFKGEKKKRTIVSSHKLIDVASPIYSNNRFIGWARVGLGQEKILSGLQIITRDGILYTLLAIVVGTLFAFFMAKGITKGLHHLVSVADGIKKGNLHLRSELDREDELGHLSEDFNLMLDAIGKSRRDLQAVMDNAPAVIYAKDKQGRYLFINKQWSALFEQGNKNAVGHTDHELFEKEFADKFIANDKAVFKAGHALNSEEVAPHEDGLHTYVSVKFPLFDEQGEPYAVCGISTDITESKNMEKEKLSLEQQLMQSQKLQAIGQLTGGVAHDFNNMLSIILGYTELSMAMAEENDSITGYLKEIYTAGERGRDLVAQMLMFSRKGKNEEHDLIPLNIVPLVKETVKMLTDTFPTNISFKVDIAVNESTVMINPVMLSQIIMNLCINARDSIKNQGEITIHLFEKDIDHSTCHSCHDSYSGQYVVLEVRDTGEGISQEIINQVFDPFFTTKEAGKGTGMGLSVVHGIVHSLNGHIDIESKKYFGTLVQVFLPLSNNNDILKDRDPDMAQDYDLTGMNIMVVDDEASIVNYLKDLLTIYGAEVAGHSNSAEALEEFSSSPENYHVVISDQTMPKLLGTEMLRSMIEVKPTLYTILCTGYSDHIDEKKAGEMGITAYFMKPVKPKELLSELQKIKLVKPG